MEKKRFRDLYNQYAKRLYNYALWLTRNTEASEDIIQCAFVKVWQHSSAPRSENEIEPWLYAVVRNKCLDFFRKCSRFSRFRLRFARETATVSADSPEKKFVWEMMSSLGEEERSILYLHFRAGYAYKEIASLMESNENAVRVRAFRALSKLRKKFVKENL